MLIWSKICLYVHEDAVYAYSIGNNLKYILNWKLFINCGDGAYMNLFFVQNKLSTYYITYILRNTDLRASNIGAW